MPSGSDTEAISTDNERDSDGDDNPQHAKGRAQPMPRAAVATRPNVNAPRVRAAKRGCARCARHVLQRTAARAQARERLTAAVAKVRAESKARFAKVRQKTRTCVAEAKHRARADALALKARKTAKFWARKEANRAKGLSGTWTWTHAARVAATAEDPAPDPAASPLPPPAPALPPPCTVLSSPS
jgi:hypothetical protein